MKDAKQNEDKVVKIQSWARGSKVRKDVAKTLAEIEGQEQEQMYYQGQMQGQYDQMQPQNAYYGQ